MTTPGDLPWRVTPDGEKQWRATDGFWYPSQNEALVASLGQPTGAPRSAPPTIYRRPKKWREVSRARKIVLVVIAAAIIGGVIAYQVGSASPPYKIDELTVKVLSAQQVDVEYRVHNLGSSPWQPSCQVQIQPLYGGGIGTATESTYSPIDGGEYGDVGGIVTISNNDANAVSVQDVSISNC